MELKNISTALIIMSSLSISSCASVGPRPNLLFPGASPTEGGSVAALLSGDDLQRISKQFGVGKETLLSRRYWWHIVGSLQQTGGWLWELPQNKDSSVLSLCLKSPAKDANVTMAFSAASALIGTDLEIPPRVSGSCDSVPDFK